MLRLDETIRLRGKVKWFNNTKGFGFIIHASGKDVFVHYSQIQDDGFRSLNEGEEVEYEMIEGPKGLHALRVRRLDRPVTPGMGLPEALSIPPEKLSKTEVFTLGD